MTAPDDLRRSLDNVAATIDVGDLDLDTVRTGARRRRRRFQLAAGLGAAALVAGTTVAVVAVTSDDEPDRLVSAEPDEPAPTTSIDDEEPSTTDLSTAPAQTVVVIDRPGVPGQDAGVAGAPAYGEWSAAWQDGFIVGSQVFAPQPLPEALPEEVTALFPQEVRDLFGGDLPPTIAEATQMLEDAGLLDVVVEIITNNPEAYDAVYSVQTQEPPTLDVRFTTDGRTWEPIEMTSPPGGGYISGATTVGDRLVLWYGPQGAPGDVGDGVVRVAATDDLVNWSVQEVATPPPSFDLPAGVTWSVQPHGFAANESGWMVSVSTGIDVDPFELIPAELRAELDERAGYSFGTDDTGIIIDVDGDGADAITYSWDQLGVAPEIAEYFGDGNWVPTTWVATWDGTPAASPSPGPMDGVIATPAGFVALGSEVGFSVDGLAWSTSPLPVEDAYVGASFAFDGGIIALVGNPAGTHVYRLDERGGSPQRLDIPGLPATAISGSGPGGRLGVVVDAADPGPPPPPAVVEADGHRLTIDYSAGTTEVVDLATDEVVATMDMRRGEEEGPISWDIRGVTVTDPATGDVVVFFPADDVDAATEAAFESSGVGDEEYSPDLWLLATSDGEAFVVDDLDDAGGEVYFGPGSLTASGSRLLLQTGSGWVVYDLR